MLSNTDSLVSDSLVKVSIESILFFTASASLLIVTTLIELEKSLPFSAASSI